MKGGGNGRKGERVRRSDRYMVRSEKNTFMYCVNWGYWTSTALQVRLGIAPLA